MLRILIISFYNNHISDNGINILLNILNIKLYYKIFILNIILIIIYKFINLLILICVTFVLHLCYMLCYICV